MHSGLKDCRAGKAVPFVPDSKPNNCQAWVIRKASGYKPPNLGSNDRTDAGAVVAILAAGADISAYKNVSEIPILPRFEIWEECYEMRIRVAGTGVTWSVVFHRHFEDCALVFLLSIRTPSRNTKTVRRRVLGNKSKIASILSRYYGDGLLGIEQESQSSSFEE